MADLTTKLKNEIGLDAVSAPAAQRKTETESKIVVPSPDVSTLPRAEMPKIERPTTVDNNTQPISQKQAEALAFQRLSRTNTPHRTRAARRGKSAKTGQYGFYGETILDKLINSLVHIIRLSVQFFTRRLGPQQGPIKTVIKKPTTMAPPSVGPTTSARRAVKKRYFPQRPQ